MEQQANAGPGAGGSQYPTRDGDGDGLIGEGFPGGGYRMSLDPVQAVGRGVLSAGQLVEAAQRVMRMGTDGPKEGDQRRNPRSGNPEVLRGGRWRTIKTIEEAPSDPGTHKSFVWRDSPRPEEFVKAVRNSSKPEFLSQLDPTDLSKHHLILSSYGTIGAAVSPDGDIQNVFNNSGRKGAGAYAIIEAIRIGGRTLDCFDGFLVGNYANFGFTEVARMKFNHEFAPSSWNLHEYGEPDIVFMARTIDLSEEEMLKNAKKPKQEWTVAARTDQFTDDWKWAKHESRKSAEAGGNG